MLLCSLPSCRHEERRGDRANAITRQVKWAISFIVSLTVMPILGRQVSGLKRKFELTIVANLFVGARQINR